MKIKNQNEQKRHRGHNPKVTLGGGRVWWLRIGPSEISTQQV